MLLDLISLLLGMFMGIGIACVIVFALVNHSNNKGDSKAEYKDFSSNELVMLNIEDRASMPFVLKMYPQSSVLNPDMEFLRDVKPEYDENGKGKIRYR